MTHPLMFHPVPRWVRATAIVALVLATLLLALGGFVTSYRVGMADPVWPTEPWYLVDKDWSKLEIGFLLEHTHRLAGWVTGAAVSVLALGAWWYEPNKVLRLAGLAAVVGLLVAYGEFHRGMGTVWTELKATAAAEYRLDATAADFEAKLGNTHLADRVTNWPAGSGVASALLAVIVLVLGLAAGPTPGGRVRAVVSAALVCVMVQGLLGGFRVFLNALMGTNLAAVHGAFGQVAFCVLVAVVVLAAPRRTGDSIPEPARGRFVALGWGLVAVLFVQLVWAVLLRHTGTGLSQRLHVLTAFAVTGLVVWLAVRLATDPAARPLKGSGYHLLGVLAVQLTLGAEAYIGKFAAVGPQAQTPPELRQVTGPQAGIRTAHQLVGAGLLASAVALALRAGRTPIAAFARAEETPRPAAEPAVVS